MRDARQLFAGSAIDFYRHVVDYSHQFHGTTDATLSVPTAGTYQFTATDTAVLGILFTSGDANPYRVVIDTTAPKAPAIAGVSTDAGAVPAGGVTRDNTPTLSGTAEANSTVTVSANGRALGTAAADSAGNWRFTPAALADGSYTFTNLRENVGLSDNQFTFKIPRGVEVRR